jgi:hypothetical protein
MEVLQEFHVTLFCFFLLTGLPLLYLLLYVVYFCLIFALSYLTALLLHFSLFLFLLIL